MSVFAPRMAPKEMQKYFRNVLLIVMVFQSLDIKWKSFYEQICIHRCILQGAHKHTECSIYTMLNASNTYIGFHRKLKKGRLEMQKREIDNQVGLARIDHFSDKLLVTWAFPLSSTLCIIIMHAFQRTTEGTSTNGRYIGMSKS